jgi:hypothetical protein
MAQDFDCSLSIEQLVLTPSRVTNQTNFLLLSRIVLPNGEQ